MLFLQSTNAYTNEVMSMNHCPNCGSKLLEDASEMITQEGDYTIVDTYPTYICKGDCGYVRRIELTDHETLSSQHKPNLFRYATSELSQDAFLCWLIEHLNFHTDDVAYAVAKELLKEIISQTNAENIDIPLEQLLHAPLTIKRQVHHIDILLTFELSNPEEKVYIMIEDKTHSGESREKQLEFYREKLKLGQSSGCIVPVLFKTGYITQKERDNFLKREIVLIDYEIIYRIFALFHPQINEDIILHNWWLHFIETYYNPIQKSINFCITDSITLRQWQQTVIKNSYVHQIVFKQLTKYLFNKIGSDYIVNSYPVQGKGHIDWHCEITKPAWQRKQDNITISFFFIWDTKTFSTVVKTSPVPYRSLSKLDEQEKSDYLKSRDVLKHELQKNRQLNWKIRHYYLQIAQLQISDDTEIKLLKEKLIDEILQITEAIDRFVILKNTKSSQA